MNYRRLLSGALCGVILCGGPRSLAQEKNAGPGQEQMDEMMKKWKEISSPGDAHKKLDAFVGTWDVEIRAWMGGPDVSPKISKGSTTFAWTIGGRYLRQDFHSEMAGMPVDGQGYTGYDNFEKKYVGVWMDNSSTAIFSLEGTMNKEETILTMYGKMDEWMTGEVGKLAKYVFRLVNKDKVVFEIHDLSIGEPNTKIVEMTYARKK
jgi:hypothetical protein